MDKTFEKWCERLLDTGKGNRLINYKDSKLRTIEIISPDIDDVFEMLIEEDRLEFFDVDEYVKEVGVQETQSEDEVEQSIKKSVPKVSKQQVLENCKEELHDNQILAYKNGFTMSKILTSMKKLSSMSLAEKGINILYAAFGFLKWRENEYSGINYNSPLILVPVKIENDSPKLPFNLVQYEDEITTNPTLVYKFKNDFGLELPEFRSEGNEDEDIEHYLERVEDFAEEHDWKVSDEIVIGTFSFLKLNMYKDLKENEKKMLSNKNISKILNSKGLLERDKIIEDFDIDGLFKKGDEINLHNVVDADSSQLEAIYKAKKGASFVLQGPPGTGKSQTITNLIAEFLYEGKKVLFVSEKLAALNVVFNKLKNAKLSDFCLELHSNKTNKKDFIAELNRVLDISKTKVSSEARTHLEELRQSKKTLDDYANALYEVQPIIERTPFQVLGAIAKYQQYPKFEYPIKDINKKDTAYLKRAVEEIQLFSKFKETVGYDYRKNIWYGYNDVGSSFESKVNLKKILSKSYDFICDLNRLRNEIVDLFDGAIVINNCNDFFKNLKLFYTISKLATFDGNYFNQKSLKDIHNKVVKYNQDKNSLEENTVLVNKLFNEEIFDLNIKNYYLRFKNDYISCFRIFNSSYRRDKKIVQQYLLDKKTKFKYDDLVSALQSVKIVQELKNKVIDQEDALFTALKSARDYNREYDWKEIENDINQLLEVVDFDIDLLYSMTNRQFDGFQKRLSDILANYEKLEDNKNALDELNQYFNGSESQLGDMDYIDLKNRIKECIDDIGNIDNWLRCKESLDSLKALGLKEFIDESIENKIPRETLAETFKYLFYSQWMYEILSNNRVLHNFTRESQDSAVKVFKEKDKLKFNIAKAQINQALTERMPNMWNSSKGQVGILLREGNKKRKQKPVRVLMREVGELIQQLKPCFLMSPLSVSTYLDFDACKFDVVIFDEASQIFPWDAVGAISRGKQVIVVGDSKQMPPTNFFNAGIIDEDDDDDEDYDDSMDFESILDLCMASLGNCHSLNWHYRSKTEDLIAFSNKNFYGGKLITFPSSRKDEDMGVQFYHVEDGIFDRKAKCNLREAEKVVDLVYDHFKLHPERSLGVVAFSVSQQDAIEEIIHRRREKDDAFAEFFDSNKVEPFFVKNLETVQGDERDTIIFSVAYGFGSDGRFLHNFGPLNKKGGERRLNVAITRAKFNVKLVASIKAYDIDLSKTNAEGSKLLKEYLECAEHGMQRLGKDLLVDPNAEPDSDFEIDVYNVLKNAGYEVDMQVGCSGYRIDLGVKHPLKSDYVLAVECDGATYHSGKTTRDRDRLRQEVLENLGWRFYRIWSTDWFKNREVEIKRLLAAVDRSIKKFDVDNNITQDFKLVEEINSEIDENLYNGDSNKFLNVIHEEKKDIKTLFKTYEEYDIYSQGLPSFASSIYPMVEKEGPITEDLLLIKVAPFFGREKVTNVVRYEFNDRMKYIKNIYKVKDYYVTDLEKKIEMRIPKDGCTPRDIKDICNDELSSGLYVVIQHNIGINKQDLFQTITNLLGFERMGNNIQFKLDQALNDLIRNGKVKEVNQQYFIRNEEEKTSKIEADDLGW
ncbi:MAG: DUF4011 domain-containing protein [Eubacteriales bacterium]|nr:DUF4011 domain-containing protein [Eubacteriales bacterium]